MSEQLSNEEIEKFIDDKESTSERKVTTFLSFTSTSCLARDLNGMEGRVKQAFIDRLDKVC